MPVLAFEAGPYEEAVDRADRKTHLEACTDLGDGGKRVARALGVVIGGLSFAKEDALTKLGVEGEPIGEGSLRSDLDHRADSVEVVADSLARGARSHLPLVVESTEAETTGDGNAEFTAVNRVTDREIDVVEIGAGND